MVMSGLSVNLTWAGLDLISAQLLLVTDKTALLDPAEEETKLRDQTGYRV